MLFRCQPGFESSLIQELATVGLAADEQGGGWARSSGADLPLGTLASLCFPHATLLDPVELRGESVNALAEAMVEHFLKSARDERFAGAWPWLIETAAGQDGLGRRADAVGRAAAELLKKRMARVAKLASSDQPRSSGEARGLFAYFVDFRRLYLARRCFFGGQRRMADDPLAPSRSYLKIEEAYGILGYEPAEGETVVDLGAAPGGWSYSAAKRGARVIAVDNGPLKGGALNHALIEHRRDDAFRFAPGEGERFDWMFCDLVEDPHHVLRNLVDPWIERAWCRRFVVILKFGRADPIQLLRKLRDPSGIMARHARNVRVRHLFHDREEFTIVGEVAS